MGLSRLNERRIFRSRPITPEPTGISTHPYADSFAAGYIHHRVCDWILAGSGMPPHLVLFLGVSFLNGMIIELGRKFRAPLDEEEGVETYTKVWGINYATGAWLAVMTLAAVASTSVAIVTARGLAGCLFNCLATVIMLALSTSMAIQFCQRPTANTAKRLQALSSIWVMTTYFSLGTLPAIARSISTCMH